MPDIQITCVNAAIKTILRTDLEAYISDPGQREQLQDLLNKTPDCPGHQLVGISAPEPEQRKKRPPSEYNLFIRDCIKKGRALDSDTTQQETLQTCSVKWKDAPENPNRRK